MDTLELAYEDCEDPDIADKGFVRASAHTLFSFKRLPAIGGVPQTLVTFNTRVSLNGVIRSSIMRRNTVGILTKLSGMRKKFDKSEEIDAARHEMTVKMIKNHAAEYSKEEDGIIEERMAKLILLDDAKSTSVRVMKAKGATPSIKNDIAFKKGDAIGWGKSETKIRGTKAKVSVGVCKWRAKGMLESFE